MSKGTPGENSHGKKGRGGPKKTKGMFEKALLEKLNAAGLDTSALIFCANSDMDNDAAYRETWLSFDERGLYIARGTAQVGKSKSKKKKLETTYTVEEIRSIPLEDVGKLKAEQYVSTGRLVCEKDGVQESLTRFSIGKLGEMDEFCRIFNDSVEGKDISAHLEKARGHDVCPKCRMPYPDGKKVCPKCEKDSSVVKRLFAFFGGYKGKVLAIIGAMLIGTAMSLFMPQISTRVLFDEVLANPDAKPAAEILSALGVLVLSIFGIRFANTVFQSGYQYMIGTIMPAVIYDIRIKIFEAMQKLSVGYYSSKQTGSMMERVMRDSNNIQWFFVDGLPYVFINGLTVIGVVAIMFIMSWKLTLLAAAIIPFLVFALVLGDRFFKRLHHRSWLYSARVSSLVSDNINGQRVIKAFSKENDEYERFSKESEGMRDSELDLSLSEATLFPILSIFVLSLTAVVLGFGGILVVRGELTVGTLLSFVVYLGMLEGPLDFLSWVSNWWSRCADSAQRVFEIVDATPDITEKPDAVSLDEVKGEIEINELVFEYEPARPVIKNLSLKVPAGTMLGIVGKTGAGKTTIANLIARLYDAKDGAVKIDGYDVRDLRLDQLRKNIGFVSQDIFLFMGSIADNIRYAKPDATMDEVIAAAKAACAHDFIMRLPDSYETRVGEGGQDLSGGERQRISIARTIIQNPKILILDEATAAMDTETERNIQASLTELKEGRTTIAIAHRLSTLRDSDYLAVIDRGEIVEYGTFSELLKQKGEFYKQYKIQSEALKTICIGD